MSIDPNARQRIPRVPGHYWVVPAAVDFPIRVFVHHYPLSTGGQTLELCASGRMVSPIEAIVHGWEWYAEKPNTAPAPDPEFVLAVALGRSLTSRPSDWQRAATALRDVVQRAGQLPCTCTDLPTRGQPGWEELQASFKRVVPAPLCLRCSALQAVARALAAERGSE